MSEPWWKAAVIYQIYPRSFQDSNRDGVGDLPGITRRLPYLVGLGVDALWISPIFPSPMRDFGYDICDYTGIDPLFGTMADFDLLLASVHRVGLKLILDFVPNHTSDRHPWFVDSRSSRASAKRDWYIWRDPSADGGPPNNWLSEFGGSAWTPDPRSGQYYYHAFLPEQPDLNWHNPQVGRAMHDVMRFWLSKGVDGFRVDVIWHLIKDDEFRDNPINPAYAPGMPPNQAVLPLHTADLPAVQDIVSGLRRVVDEFPERLLIGEIYLPIERLVAYYGHDLAGVHLPFNFALLHTPWNARAVSTLIDAYEAALPAGGWPNWVLGNHDRARIASRVGSAQARVAAMLLLTLRGDADNLLRRRDRNAAGPDSAGSGAAIRLRNEFPGLGSAAMARVPRCNGMQATLPGSRRSSHGYRLPIASAAGTSRDSYRTRPRSIISTGA